MVLLKDHGAAGAQQQVAASAASQRVRATHDRCWTETLQAAHERVDPIEQGVFGVFSERDLAFFRELQSRFIDAFDKA